ncbi:hypothetical protein Avbf_17070 [Armadillidium vulgare]|nr:hypothetical protein Avbf_17070 [Armadillidium vulgare]
MPYLNGDDLVGTERKTIFNLLLVQEVELIMKKNISDMCECLKTLCRKLKKELSMNHLMDIVQYLGPDSDCLFIKEYSSLEDIPNSIYYGPCLWVENTFSLGDCIIQISKNQFVKYEKFCMLEASIIVFCIYYLKNLSYPKKYGQYLGLLQSLLTDTKFEMFIKITLH